MSDPDVGGIILFQKAKLQPIWILFLTVEHIHGHVFRVVMMNIAYAWPVLEDVVCMDHWVIFEKVS